MRKRLRTPLIAVVALAAFLAAPAGAHNAPHYKNGDYQSCGWYGFHNTTFNSSTSGRAFTQTDWVNGSFYDPDCGNDVRVRVYLSSGGSITKYGSNNYASLNFTNTSFGYTRHYQEVGNSTYYVAMT